MIELLTWVPWSLEVGPGLDQSWITGLHLAAEHRLDHGSELIFTYGPLGYLAFPSVADGTVPLSILYLIALRYAFSASLLWAARRSFPLYLAFPLALVVAVITTNEELPAIALISCCVALAPNPPRLAQPLVVFGNALLAGVALLFKANIGFLVLAISLIAVCAFPGDRRRNVLAFLGTLAVWLTVLLLATGQSLGGVPDYLVAGLQVSSGYQTAQVAGEPSAGSLLLSIFLVLAVVGAASLSTARLPWIRRAGLIAILLVFSFVEFKGGFVRHGGTHTARFLAAMTVPWFAVPWVGPAQKALAATAIGAIAILWFPLSSIDPGQRLDLISNAGGGFDDIAAAIDGGERREIRDASRAALQDHYGLEPSELRLLEAQTVHVEPWEVSLVWAYGLDWKPEPVFQAYLASTPWLDRLNADSFSDPDGPTRVLRRATYPGETPGGLPGPEHLTSIDNRFAAYDAPAQTLALLCHYEPLSTTRSHQILGRTGNRCGAERDLGATTARYGEPVIVPHPPGPNEIVIAKIDGVEPSGLEDLRTVLYRGLRRYIAFDDQPSYELTPLNAGQGLIVRAPPSVDFPPPFALAPNPRTLTLTRESGPFADDQDLQIRFIGIRVSPREGADGR